MTKLLFILKYLSPFHFFPEFFCQDAQDKLLPGKLRRKYQGRGSTYRKDPEDKKNQSSDWDS